MYLACVPGVDKKIHPSGFVQQGGDSASLVTAYAALRPRDGFSHPHLEHMKDTYIITYTFVQSFSLKHGCLSDHYYRFAFTHYTIT